MPVLASVIDCIGNTPVVDVSALGPNPAVRILAKLEMVPSVVEARRRKTG